MCDRVKSTRVVAKAYRYADPEDDYCDGAGDVFRREFAVERLLGVPAGED